MTTDRSLKSIMEKKNIAHVIRTIEGWYDPSFDEAPMPPAPLVDFLRELVTGLKELPPGSTEIKAESLANIISSGLGEMPGNW
jgi:hypothetical protein